MMRKLTALLVAVFLPTSLAIAQGTTTLPPIDFSGVLFGNYQWRTDDAARVQTAGQALSKFDIGRAYLTFRMPAGEHGSIRITTDIFNQTPSTYYSGWAVRLKYGYFQYDFTRNFAGVQGLGAVGRIGMLHTAVIDHEEGFWPRYLTTVPLETYFGWASADVGVAGLFTLPKKFGEIYTTIANGSNYSSGETDRFSLLRTLTLSPWYSIGGTASQFVLGGGAQVGPVSDGLKRDRMGLFLGLKERRLTAGAEVARQNDEVESGANTVASPRVVTDRKRDVASGFALVRPLEMFNAKRRSPWGVHGRFDGYQPKVQDPAAVNPNTHAVILGTFWDVNARTTMALDYQETKTTTGGATTFPIKTLYLHWNVSF